jgi:hypothetical protein
LSPSQYASTRARSGATCVDTIGLHTVKLRTWVGGHLDSFGRLKPNLHRPGG